MKSLIKLIGVGAVFVSLAWFFSYRILTTPLGLTSDEGGFGINAVYLARTLHDENGVFLPVFALSLGGKEWRQPVTQYYMAGFFKLFGTTLFNLRFSSVVITLVSALLIYFLAKQIFDQKWGIFAAFIFLTTPLIMIQSHLGLDNIMPIPFVIAWLLFLALYSKTKKISALVYAGISLGIGFYTYKGMRATVPVWSILTVIYLTILEWKNKRKMIIAIFSFSLGIAPFFLVIPYLERRYPGAVFDHQGFKWDSWYTFLYPYLSSFDPSFLFIQGDALLFHSTGKHGMMLLSSAPLFFIGLYQSIRHRNFKLFVLISFFCTPLLFGFVDSVHRASRLMSMIPAYVLIATLGAKTLWENKKVLLVVVTIIMILNYGDFVNFYWNKYAELTRNIFGDMSYYQDYISFNKEIKALKRAPYVEEDIASDDGATGEFFQLSYLPDDVRFIDKGEELPADGILLSLRENIPGLKRLPIKTIKYRIHTP